MSREGEPKLPFAENGERPSATEPRLLLESLAPEALGVLASLMQDTGQKPELRMKAAESILDRACGKSGLASSGEGGGMVIRFEGELEEWSR